MSYLYPKTWTYETGRFTCNALDSGEAKINVLRTKDETAAIERYQSHHLDYLIRFQYDDNHRRTQETYDTTSKTWIPEETYAD